MTELKLEDIQNIATKLKIDGGLVEDDYTSILKSLKENKNPYA